MLFKNITIIDDALNGKENMYVGVQNEKITYIGESMPQNASDFGRVYDGKNKLLMNGLFNGHGHSPMTLLRGYAEDMNLQEWLNNHIFPFEGKLTDNDCYWGTVLADAEMMRTGTVSVTDMYGHMNAVLSAHLDTGFKANLSNGLMAFDDTPFEKNRNHLEEMEMSEKFNGANGGRIQVEKSVHAVYTSNQNIVKAVAEFAKENNCSVHIHLSETKTEVDECIEKYGVSPVRYFYEAGLFESHTVAAHCVWLSEEDMDILSSCGVFAAHNPVSNLKLASGVADIPKMQEKGIRITIGTDGCSSNNNLDMFEEIKLCAILNKGVRYNPTVTPAKDVLRYATLNGALAQRRTDCGALKVGNKADLIVLDLSTPSMQPVHDVLNNVVYAGSGKDVILTMIDGAVVYENGEYKTLDIEKAVYEVTKSKNRILRELKA